MRPLYLRCNNCGCEWKSRGGRPRCPQCYTQGNANQARKWREEEEKRDNELVIWYILAFIALLVLLVAFG